jgi:4-hydroxybenzoyl-CoA thioesterase
VTSTESVISKLPFTVLRRVRFGDCDPAGVVYTVRFSDYAVSAMDLFLSALLGGPYLDVLTGVQTPMKALAFVFSAPLRPNDEFDMVVTVRDLRTRTFDLVIAASLLDGTLAFEATVTPICISDGSERRSIAIPERLRNLLTHYQQRTGSGYATTLSD